MKIRKVVSYSACALFFGSFVSSSAQVNSWNNPLSARWEDPYWSLGVLPASDQSIMVTNSGFKAVGIWPSTVANFPASLTVNNVTINGPTNGYNTLLLNYSGSAVPLHVRDGLNIGRNGVLLNLYAGLQVDGSAGDGLNVLPGGKLIQESGTLVATNAT